jgi:hypothetical protein
LLGINFKDKVFYDKSEIHDVFNGLEGTNRSH